jgi:LysR family transcriptional regulator for metE and metH
VLAFESIVQNFETSLINTEVLRPAQVQPRRILELQLTEAVLATVRAGIGVTVMAEWAVQPQLEDGTIRTVRITQEGIQRTWSAATTRKKARLPAIQRLVGVLKEQAMGAAMAAPRR